MYAFHRAFGNWSCLSHCRHARTDRCSRSLYLSRARAGAQAHALLAPRAPVAARGVSGLQLSAGAVVRRGQGEEGPRRSRRRSPWTRFVRRPVRTRGARGRRLGEDAHGADRRRQSFARLHGRDPFAEAKGRWEYDGKELILELTRTFEDVKSTFSTTRVFIGDVIALNDVPPQVQGAIKMTPSPTSDDMLRIPRHTLPTDAVGASVAVKIPEIPGAPLGVRAPNAMCAGGASIAYRERSSTQFGSRRAPRVVGLVRLHLDCGVLRIDRSTLRSEAQGISGGRARSPHSLLVRRPSPCGGARGIAVEYELALAARAELGLATLVAEVAPRARPRSSSCRPALPPRPA